MPYDVHSNMSYFYGMVVGDFYNDGQPAIAYADSFTSQRAMMRHDKDAVVYLNTLDKGSVEIFREDMSFAPSQVDRVKLIERMVAMDINGDGLMDIVAIANSHDSVVAYLNRGPDVAWERLVLTVETPGAVNLALADPDGDGDLDIMVTMRNQTTAFPAPKPGLGWLRNDGNGVFVYRDISVAAGLDEPRTVQRVHRPGYKNDRIIVSNLNTDDVLAFKLDDAGEWVSRAVKGVDALGSYYNLSTDIDLDGSDELIFGDLDGIYQAKFIDRLSNPEVTKITGFGDFYNARVSEIVAGDVTGNSRDDIVFSVIGLGIYYSTVDDDGVWQTHPITEDGGNYHGVAVLDYDGDGLLDVAANIELPTNSLRIFRNEGPIQ